MWIEISNVEALLVYKMVLNTIVVKKWCNIIYVYIPNQKRVQLFLISGDGVMSVTKKYIIMKNNKKYIITFSSYLWN